jgi:alcohol dehydrogenase
MVMENFSFQNPVKIIFGKNTISRIGPKIKAAGFNKILLLCGGGSIKKNGVYDQVSKSLNSQGIETVEVWGVRPNPILSKVREAIQVAREKNVQAILAVGGGSVIDSAKSIAAGFYLDDVWAAFEDKLDIVRALPLFTVLTVSGAASEMNQWAVLTNEVEKKKWSIGAEVLFPVLTIIDPSVQMSLPWLQTVAGAMDAIAHLLENYFMGADQETTLAIDEALMRTIIRMTDALQKNPKDYDSRANLVWAAGLAHAGLSSVAMKGGDWSAHGIEHGVSALHPEVAHGAGLGVIFPAWILYQQKVNPPIFKRWAKNVMAAATVAQAVNKFRALLKKWQAPVWLPDLGIKKTEIKAIAQNANGRGTLGNLKKLSLKDIQDILKLTLKK